MDTPEPTIATEQAQLLSLEERLRATLSFDQSVGSLMYNTMLVMGIVPESNKGRAIQSGINVDELWKNSYNELLTQRTEAQIEQYITAIRGLQDSLNAAYDKMGEDVVASIERLSATIPNV